MVWSKIAQVFSFGNQWGDDTVQLVEGNDASVMLRRVEGILEDSMRVLSSHERLLSSGEFNAFSIKYRSLLLKVVEVKQDIREEQSQSTLSSRSAGQTYNINQEVYHLYMQAQIYQRDVLTASRRAQVDEDREFEQLQNMNFRPEPKASEPIEPATTYWLLRSGTTSENFRLADRKPYLAIAHIHPNQPGASDGMDPKEDKTYREIIIIESNGKTMIMINPNHRYFDREPDPSDGTLPLASLIPLSESMRSQSRHFLKCPVQEELYSELPAPKDFKDMK
ncbi:unnamed protein product [Rhizoctonia solani]|uniref:Uncharacterized protein n=1 Tax=Rhizoctonia solani TaxID=456999 RepID=A0A8H3DL42_9AGAM|nr:unnamed protein product [Rhizoctonia solani]CAE6532575.1 unnamed protein product [Rhizoctonia solani]